MFFSEAHLDSYFLASLKSLWVFVAVSAGTSVKNIFYFLQNLCGKE